MTRIKFLPLGTFLLTIPVRCFAQLDVGSWGVGFITWEMIMNNLQDTIYASIATVCGAVFVIGAFYVILGFASTENVNKGKKMMIGALIGMGVSMSSLAILNTVLYFLYG